MAAASDPRPEGPRVRSGEELPVPECHRVPVPRAATAAPPGEGVLHQQSALRPAQETAEWNCFQVGHF